MTMGSSSDDKVTIKLDGLTLALSIGAILYIWCLFQVWPKLASLHRMNPDLSLHKLLILSVGLVCIVRIMSFLGVACLNLANVAAHYTLNSNDSEESEDENQEFYDAAMTVLFDLPNCIVASTYVLFALVWAESFVHSRLHTDSRFKWKRNIVLSYVIFNLLLYSAQTTLYCLVFWPTNNTEKIFRTILYVFVTVINFCLVLLMIGLYVWLTFHFSGYPYRSEKAKTAFGKISNVMMLWTIARIAWAISFLVVYIKNIELLDDSDTPWWSFILLSLYILCEVVPIYYMLKSSVRYIVRLDSNQKAGMEDEALLSSSSTQYRPPSELGPSREYFFNGSEENPLVATTISADSDGEYGIDTSGRTSTGGYISEFTT